MLYFFARSYKGNCVKKKLKWNYVKKCIEIDILLYAVKINFLKKIIHILFTIVFTVVTLGFIINKHYSGGELFSLALFGEPESCCEDMCGCCDEESETIQFLVYYTFTIDNFDTNPIELELFAAAILLSLQETELVLAKTEYIDQDLPPPDNLTRLSYNQAFLL